MYPSVSVETDATDDKLIINNRSTRLCGNHEFI